VIVESGIMPESLTEAAKTCGFRGERRSLRIPLADLQWALEGSVLTLCFSLPPGAYATSVLRELMKNDSQAAENAR
jgi:tRNA pseudouridine13 synthase